MTQSGLQLDRRMRAVLLACGPMNVLGAVAFAPPVQQFRTANGLPDSHPFYLWVLSAWILAFGAAYFMMGWTGRANAAVLALGVAGKGSFAGSVLLYAAVGEFPPLAAASAGPDLLLAVLFAVWLWRHRAAV